MHSTATSASSRKGFQVNRIQTSASTVGRARRVNGFTLIEMMITVVIIGILAAIAIPIYRDYALRGQIVDATNGLSALRSNMERYYQDNRTYTSANGFTSPCKIAATSLVSGSFQLSCPDATLTDTGYSLKAVGSGPTVAFTYTVDQSNNRATTVTNGPSGWTSCTTDWVTRNGQSC